MKKLFRTCLMALGFIAIGLFSYSKEAKAATIDYKYLDGTVVKDAGDTPITTDNTTYSTFAEATTAIEAVVGAGNVICYVDENDIYKGIYTPVDTSIAAGGTVKVVTKDMVTAGDVFDATDGTAWFIYQGTLYIVATKTNGVFRDVSASPSYYGNGDRILSFSNNSFDAKVPSMEKGDVRPTPLGDGYGMHPSAVGDEKGIAADSYYIYDNNTADKKVLGVMSRDTLTINPTKKYLLPKGRLKPESVPWKDNAGIITEVIFGSDVMVEGNIAALFNGNIDYTDGHINVGKVGESIYDELEQILIYADMSGVTSMAATFARCPKLVNIAVYDPATGTPLTTAYDLSTLHSTAFMFYGDTLLSNEYDGSLIDLMDLSSGNLQNTMYMFAGCESVIRPKVKDYNMSGVENIDGMFMGAKNAYITFATGVDTSVASWDVSNVESAMYTFAGEIAPGEGTGGKPDFDHPTAHISPGFDEIATNHVLDDGTVDLTKWDMAKVKITYHMFAKNTGATGVTFDDNYPELVDASGMFNGAINLASVALTGTQMNNLKYAYAMFRRAGSSETAKQGMANLSGWESGSLLGTAFMFDGAGYRTINCDDTDDMSTAKEFTAMFADNPYLESLGSKALEDWRLVSALDTKYMFAGDSALASVKVASWEMPNVENVSHMFSDCSALDALATADWVIGSGDSDGDGKYLEDMECFAYNTKISPISMKEWDTTKTVNMYMAFAKNPAATAATLPEIADAFNKVEDTNGMFAFCSKLETVGGDDSNFYAAPELVDAKGMFAFCPKLTQVGVKGLIKGTATEGMTTAYMFRGDSALTSADISGWNTANVQFMQGMFDGCKKLEEIVIGDDLSSAKLKSMAMMFRDCYVLGDSLDDIIKKFTSTTLLEDMRQAFKNCYAITTLDLSPMSLAAAKDLVQLAYMAENGSMVTNKLTTIIVPADIMTATGLVETDATDGNGTSINMFWVDGDGIADDDFQENSAEDDLLTTFIVNGEIPAKLKAYNFGGELGDNDNRSFVSYEGRTINDENVGSYTFTSDADVAALKVAATSKLYKNGNKVATAELVPLAYKWDKGGTAITGATTATYNTEPNAGGTYHVEVTPGELTGKNTKHGATYLLTAKPVVPKKIEAVYSGPNIAKGSSFAKADVTVDYYDSEGVKHTLTTADWTVDSLVVPNLGDNTFTVKYNPGDGELTDTITVTGVEPGTSYISATYIGDPVAINENFNKSDVKVIYTNEGGTNVTLGPSDWTVPSQEVTAIGDNTFTATYKPDGKPALTDTFVVEGVHAVAGIKATYEGDPVPVGTEYSKSDVKVVITLEDGSTATLTPDDFTVDSQKVTKKGDNTYTVTFDDGIHKYTDTITVPGKRVIGSIVSTYSGPAVLVGNDYDPANVNTMAYYADDVNRTEGFKVTPSGYSSMKVTAVGDNNFTATYRDPDQGDKAFTSVFKVNGYKTVTSIGATYTGDKIKVGDSYKKKDVKLTLYYADGTSGTTENFTVDSLVVTGEGSNSYTATYRDPFGNTYTAGYTVPGYKKDDDKGSSSSGDSGSGNYAGVSSVWPGVGTGYAQSTPVLGGLGVSSGVVQTGTTGKAVLYSVAFIILCGLIAFAVVTRLKEKDKDR